MSSSLGALAECALLSSISSSTPAERLAEVAQFKHVNSIAGSALEAAVKRDLAPLESDLILQAAAAAADQQPPDREATVLTLEQTAKEEPLKLTQTERLLASNPLRRSTALTPNGDRSKKRISSKPVSYAIDPDIVRGSDRQFQMQLYYLLWGECVETDTEGVHPVVSSSKQAQDLFADLNVADVLLYGRSGVNPTPPNNANVNANNNNTTIGTSTSRSTQSTSRMSRPSSRHSMNVDSPHPQPVSPLQWFYMQKQNVTNEKKLCRKVDFDHRHVVPEFENRENETPIVGTGPLSTPHQPTSATNNGVNGAKTDNSALITAKKQAGLVKTCEIICERFRLDPTIEEEEQAAAAAAAAAAALHSGDGGVGVGLVEFPVGGGVYPPSLSSPSHSPPRSRLGSAVRMRSTSGGRKGSAPSNRRMSHTPQPAATQATTTMTSPTTARAKHGDAPTGIDEEENGDGRQLSVLPVSSTVDDNSSDDDDPHPRRRSSHHPPLHPSGGGGSGNVSRVASARRSASHLSKSPPTALDHFHHRMTLHGRTDPTQTKLDKLYFNKDDLRTFLRNPYGKGALLKFVISKSTSCELIRCTWIDKGTHDTTTQPAASRSRHPTSTAGASHPSSTSPFSSRAIKFLVQTRTNSFKLNDNGFSYFERTLTYPHPHDHRIELHDLENEYNLNEHILGHVQHQSEYLKARRSDRERERLKVLMKRKTAAQRNGTTFVDDTPTSTTTTNSETAQPLQDDTATLIAQKNNQHYTIRNYEPGSQLYETLRSTCDKLAAYFDLVISSAPGPKRRTKKMQLYFRRDACNQYWLLWSDCLEFEDPIAAAAAAAAAANATTALHSSPLTSPINRPTSSANRNRSSVDVIPNHAVGSAIDSRSMMNSINRNATGIATMKISEEKRPDYLHHPDAAGDRRDHRAISSRRDIGGGGDYDDDAFSDGEFEVDIDENEFEGGEDGTGRGGRGGADSKKMSPLIGSIDGANASYDVSLDESSTSFHLHLNGDLAGASDDDGDGIDSTTTSGRGSWRAPRSPIVRKKKNRSSVSSMVGIGMSGAGSLAGAAPRALGEPTPGTHESDDSSEEEEIKPVQVKKLTCSHCRVSTLKHDIYFLQLHTLLHTYNLEASSNGFFHQRKTEWTSAEWQEAPVSLVETKEEARRETASRNATARADRRMSNALSSPSMGGLDSPTASSRRMSMGFDSPSSTSRRHTGTGSIPGSPMVASGPASGRFFPPFSPLGPTALVPDPIANLTGGKKPAAVAVSEKPKETPPSFALFLDPTLTIDEFDARRKDRTYLDQDVPLCGKCVTHVWMDPLLVREKFGQSINPIQHTLANQKSLGAADGSGTGITIPPFAWLRKQRMSPYDKAHAQDYATSDESKPANQHGGVVGDDGGVGVVDGVPSVSTHSTSRKTGRKNFIAHNVALSKSGAHYVSPSTRKAQRDLSTGEGKDAYTCEKGLENRWAHYSDAKEDRDLSSSLQGRLIASGAASATIYSVGGLTRKPEDMDRVYGLKYLADGGEHGLGGYYSTRIDFGMDSTTSGGTTTKSTNGLLDLHRSVARSNTNRSASSPMKKKQAPVPTSAESYRSPSRTVPKHPLLEQRMQQKAEHAAAEQRSLQSSPLAEPRSKKGKLLALEAERQHDEAMNFGEGDLAEPSPSKGAGGDISSSPATNGSSSKKKSLPSSSAPHHIRESSSTFLTALGEEDFPALAVELDLDEISSGIVRKVEPPQQPQPDESERAEGEGDEDGANTDGSSSSQTMTIDPAAQLSNLIGTSTPSKHSFASRMDARASAKAAQRREREERDIEIARTKHDMELALRASRRRPSPMARPPTVMPGHEPAPGQATIYDRPLESPSESFARRRPPNQPTDVMDKELREQTWYRVHAVLRERRSLKQDQDEKKLIFRIPADSPFTLSATGPDPALVESRRKERALVYRELRRAQSVQSLRLDHGGPPRSPERDRDRDPSKVKKHTLSHSHSASGILPSDMNQLTPIAYATSKMPSIDGHTPNEIIKHTNVKQLLDLHLQPTFTTQNTPIKKKPTPTNTTTLPPTTATPLSPSRVTPQKWQPSPIQRQPISPAHMQRINRIAGVYSLTPDKVESSVAFQRHSKDDTSEVKRRHHPTIVPSTLHVVSMPDPNSPDKKRSNKFVIPPTRAQLLQQALGIAPPQPVAPVRKTRTKTNKTDKSQTLANNEYATPAHQQEESKINEDVDIEPERQMLESTSGDPTPPAVLESSEPHSTRVDSTLSSESVPSPASEPLVDAVGSRSVDPVDPTPAPASVETSQPIADDDITNTPISHHAPAVGIKSNNESTNNNNDETIETHAVPHESTPPTPSEVAPLVDQPSLTPPEVDPQADVAVVDTQPTVDPSDTPAHADVPVDPTPSPLLGDLDPPVGDTPRSRVDSCVVGANRFDDIDADGDDDDTLATFGTGHPIETVSPSLSRSELAQTSTPTTTTTSDPVPTTNGDGMTTNTGHENDVIVEPHATAHTPDEEETPIAQVEPAQPTPVDTTN